MDNPRVTDLPLDIGGSPLSPPKKLDPLSSAPTPPAKPDPEPAKPQQNELTEANKIGEATKIADKKVAALDAQSMQMTAPALQMPAKPDPKKTDPIEAWGSAAMVFAALGGMLTRNHLSSALDSATAVLNGIKAKDEKAAETAYKNWEVESRNAIDLARFQTDAYKTAMANVSHREDLAVRQGTEAERVAEAKTKAVAHAYSDAVMLDAIQRKGLAGAVEVQKGREELTNRMETNKIQISKNYETLRAQNEWDQTPEGQAASQEEKFEKHMEIAHQLGASAKDKQGLPMKPEQIEFLAQQYARYERDPPGQFLERQPGYREALARAKELNPEFEPSDASTIKRMKTDLTVGKGGQTLQSLSALQQHLTFLEKLAKELPNDADMQTMNSVAARVAKQFGMPNVTNFEAARTIVGGEAVKAIVGVNGGALADREEIREAFKTEASKAQLQGTIDTVRNLVGGQIKALKDRYSSLPERLQDRYFKPDVVDYYTKHGDKPGDSTQNPVTPKTMGEARALPKGTWITGPDGQPHQIDGTEPWQAR